jgi:transcriptional regulator with XRE-family HTH domain
MPRNAHPELREAATLSQEELAHRARLDRSDMSGIEGGVRNPPS